MKLLALTICVSVTALGCGDSNDGENAGGAGGGAPAGECPAGETLIIKAGEVQCGGFVEDTKLPINEAFDSCGEAAPNTSCSLEEFCALMSCGAAHSMFGADGCRRTICDTNEDCPSGQICYTTTTEEDGCLSNAGFACAPIDDSPCDCIANAICGEESHCIDE